MDNYEIARDRAQEYFLQFNQNAIIQSKDIPFDEAYLYVGFCGEQYKICRQTGQVTHLRDGSQAGYSEVLSIFDILCHRVEEPYLIGRYAPVNSLRGRPVSVGVDTGFYEKTAKFFEADMEGFHKACLAMGAVPEKMGDAAYSIPIFGQLRGILKFYHSDEEFPASITFLWDENTLSFMYYETVFYVAGCILSAICKRMKRQEEEQ